MSKPREFTDANFQNEVLDSDEIQQLIGPGVHDHQPAGSGLASDAATVDDRP